MDQTHPQAWLRNTSRQPTDPLSSRFLHAIELAFRFVRMMILPRAGALARPVVTSRNFRAELKAAFFGGAFILLYRGIMAAGMITAIPDLIDSHQVQATLVTQQSGFASRLDQNLTRLDATYPIIGDNLQNEPVKLFLTFSLPELPAQATVDRAKLSFQCSLVGDISGFGDLSVHPVDFTGYSAAVFDSFPLEKNNYRARIFLVDNEPLLSGCNPGQTVAYANEALAQMVDSQLSAGNIHLVVYFEENSVLANHQADGIKIEALPQLTVTYHH